MEKVTIWLTPKDIVAKILTIDIISKLEDSSEIEDIGREPFDIWLRDFNQQRVSVLVSCETFYRLSRICNLI